MDSKLSASIAALRKAVKSPNSAMFWQETMGHVAIVLDHLQMLISDGRPVPVPGPKGWYEIDDELLGWVVDQVFDGAIEDDTPIRDIYRLIARDLLAARHYTHSAPKSLRDVLSERIRQIADKGHHPEHDDEYSDGALVLAAVCYAEEAHCRINDPERPMRLTRIVPEHWPWGEDDWKPSGGVRFNLVKSVALLLAEIDRIDRVINIQEQGAAHG
ncbi:TPA: hypothetical protein ACVGJ5_004452 [Pseudomonas aeruginosa]